MTLQHLRSSTANKRPDPNAMADGQIALNTAAASPGLFYKDSAGNLVKAGPVHVGSTAPNVSPASGGTAGNSTGEAWLDTSGSNPLLKIWSGAAWQTVQPVASGTVVSTADTGSVTSTMIANGTIVDADVNASAAIAGTKVSPDFGSQTITTTGVVSAAAGAAATPSITFTGDLNTGIYSPGADQVAISTSGTGKLFVNASGNVSIGTNGTSAATETLCINGFAGFGDRALTNPFVLLGNTGSGAGLVGTYSNHALEFRTNNSERLRITSAGLVGVGTTSPEYLVHAASAVTGGDDVGFRMQDTTNSKIVQLMRTGSTFSYIGIGNTEGVVYSQNTLSLAADDSSPIKFCTGAERMRITAAGLVGIGTSSPSYRLHVSDSSDTFLNVASTGTIQSAILRLVGRQTSVDEEWNIVSTGSGLASSALRFVRGGWTGTPSMLIDSSGRVGIGTQSPTDLLSVGTLGTSTDATLTIGSSTSAYGSIYFGDGVGSARYRGYIQYNHANDSLCFGTSANDAVCIDSSRRLLVGTSTSSGVGSTLQVRNDASAAAMDIFRSDATTGTSIFGLNKSRGTAATPLEVANNDALGYIAFRGYDGTAYQDAAYIHAECDGTWTDGGDTSDNPGRLVFSTTADGAASPTERMRINNAGTLNIFSSDQGLNSRVSAGSGTNEDIFLGRHSATNTSSGTISFQVKANGNVQNTNNSYGAISDIKLKENIVDASSQWEDIKSLQVRKYNFKEETNQQTHTQIGLVAQEVELVSPGLVSESPDRDDEGNDLGTVTKSVNYSVLYMKAVKALQEAIGRIETLEAEVAALKAQ